MLLLLGALAVYAARGGAIADLDGLKRDVLATLGYVANWRFVAAGQSYFDQFADPSPLRHAWSLAIEEQYYLLWPLLLLGLFKLARGNRRTVLLATLALATLSAITMAVLFTPGADPSRVYYGTDTRAFELLAGSALALLVAGRTWRVPDGVGLVALAALVAGWLTVGDDTAWMYRGGFVVGTLLAVVVVAAVARPDLGPLGRALSLRPLRALGRISYGVYLWHWPVIVLLRPPTVDVSGDALRVLQVAVTLAASTLSYVLLEQPIRTNTWTWLRGPTAKLAAPAFAAVVATVVLVAGSTPTLTPSTASAAAPVTPTARASRSTFDAPALDLVAHRVPTADDPLRVLLVGDSVMVDASPGIEAALEATGVTVVEPGAAAGFGLTFTETWREDWSTMVDRTEADVVVVLLGAWDMDTALDRGREWFTGVVVDATAVVAAGGARVVWLGWPPTHPPAIAGRPDPDYDHIERGRTLVDAVFADVARRHPADVAFLSTAPPLELDGEFSAFLPDTDGDMVRARKRDNTHFCPAGAERMGRYVLDALTPVFSLPDADPSWTTGAWRADARYDDPPGACS